jgi:hypothetical protein
MDDQDLQFVVQELIEKDGVGEAEREPGVADVEMDSV